MLLNRGIITSTHPHPPKMFSQLPPPTQNNAPPTNTHLHLPKMMPYPPPHTQNNAPPTSTHSK